MTNDDIRLIHDVLDERLSHPLDRRDVDAVRRELGRFPRGMVAVGARCVCGSPLAVITRPLVDGRTPFPTTCYLTSPEAVKAVSRLEAAGRMAEYTRQVQEDSDIYAAYERAHDLYLAFRHELAERLGDSEEHIEGISAGGMPVRVKCLHALVGQSLVMGRGVNPIGDMVLDEVAGEFDPGVCRCSVRVADPGESTEPDTERKDV
ncbi:DUF501 domain-containing protein [Bifidobacterium sp. 82T24]|uniref:DUF501 domain-containing protein n=1 Tax=Bifidobacterium pluvialisilvae TaxID=2834436 RepID=UPI001C55BFE2|nr:DUF501 domain-containing protein [Bifidobacterium pluvialisilvae]MBW3087877.1 DUF501 domain-containing protein [Bifidobacterium pluvialisilvae]